MTTKCEECDKEITGRYLVVHYALGPFSMCESCAAKWGWAMWPELRGVANDQD